MSWFKGSFDRQFKIFYLPTIAGLASFVILMAGLTRARTFGLLAIVGILTAIHWDLRDGGLLSKLVYSFGGSFNQRNYITVLASFVFVTLILALTGGFASPILLIYCLPIVYASIRGGRRMSIPFGMFLISTIWTYFYFFGSQGDYKMSEINLYLALFGGISTATGFISDRLRRAAVDLSALYETGRALSSTLDAPEVIRLAMNIISLDVKPDLAAIFILETKNVLKIRESRGFKDDVGDWEIKLGRGLVGKAAEKSESIMTSQRSRRWKLDRGPDFESKVAVPIKFKNQLIGVLLAAKENDHSISFENVRFLEALASQMAISLQNAKLYQKTKEWASMDGMTGVHNFRYFSERLDMEWNRAIRYEKPLSLIMIDLDLFKSINDTHGHLCGDKVLRDFAGLLKQMTRETDIVARYGGEEFVVVLPETHYDDACVVAEKLRQKTEKTAFNVDESDQPISITISLGIANYPTTAFTKDDLIYQADQALYVAKNQRNTLSTPLDQATKINVTSTELS